MKIAFAAFISTVAGLFLFTLGLLRFSPGVAPSAAPAPVFSGAKTWGGAGASVMAKSVRVDAAGNRYTAGEFQGTVDFDPAGPNPAATVTSLNGTTDAYLSKVDAGGNFQWVRTWGSGPTGGNTAQGFGRDAANGLALDVAGNLYVAGLYQTTVDFGSGFVFTSNAPAGSNNIFLARFASDGTTQWVRAWGGATGGEGYSVAVDRQNGYVYVQGDWSTSPNTGTVDFNPAGPVHDPHANHGFYDAFLSKYDLNGNFQWAKTWGGEGYDDGPGVTVDGTGNVYVGGMYGSQTINFDPAGGPDGLGHPATNTGNPVVYVDVFLSKFDGAGDFKWVRTWGGLNGASSGTVNAGELVAADGAGDVYIVGRYGCAHCNFNAGPTALTDPDIHSSNGDVDTFVGKYDANGNFLWARTWGGSGTDGGGGLAVDSANNVYVGGIFSGTVDFGVGPVSSNGQFDFSLSKFSAGGALQWVRTWGGPGKDIAYGLTLDNANNLYAYGVFQNVVDFDPGSGTDNHSALGTQDACISKFSLGPVSFLSLPLILR